MAHPFHFCSQIEEPAIWKNNYPLRYKHGNIWIFWLKMIKILDSRWSWPKFVLRYLDIICSVCCSSSKCEWRCCTCFPITVHNHCGRWLTFEHLLSQVVLVSKYFYTDFIYILCWPVFVPQMIGTAPALLDVVKVSVIHAPLSCVNVPAVGPPITNV